MDTRSVLLSPPEQRWECPNCPATFVSQSAQPHTPYHECAGLRGLNAPFVPAGQRCKVEAHERQDYVGTEDVQVDGAGRPVMSLTVTRDEGTDLTVYAPCARADLRGHG